MPSRVAEAFAGVAHLTEIVRKMRRRSSRLAVIAAVLFHGSHAAAQGVGRSAKLVLSDSLTVLVRIGAADSSVIAFTPQGGFRLRADSAALANWAKATERLAPPGAAAGKGPEDRSALSAAVLRANDGSGNAMRLMRLSADSIPEYQLAGTNGAWEFREKISPAKGALLIAALGGRSGSGLEWTPFAQVRDSAVPDFQPAEAVPDNPRPKYPAKAEIAQASGSVVAQFAVGIDGRARRESLLIVRASHPLFALAVRDVLPQMRFLPAKLHGSPVEQVVIEEFQFRAQ